MLTYDRLRSAIVKLLGMFSIEAETLLSVLEDMDSEPNELLAAVEMAEAL